MKRVNDPKIVPILCDLLINDPIYVVRSNAAKALGYKKVTISVPYLKKALNDKDFGVRKEAFIALYILTGQKYTFNGRDAAVEQTAEQQKKYPTFW
jgi:HEAT repeat protein